MGKQIASPIFTTNLPFEVCTEDEILNGLEDHEFIHAEHMHNEIIMPDGSLFLPHPKIPYETLLNISEVIAYQNQIVQSMLKGGDEQHILDLSESLNNKLINFVGYPSSEEHEEAKEDKGYAQVKYGA